MAEPSPAADEQRRPAAVLLVYTWDMVSAIIAIFEALAPFAGGVAVGPRLVAVPLALQVLGALSSAAYAAVLIIVASLLTRRLRWIPRVQILTLGIAVVLTVVSLVIGWFGGGVDATAILTATLVMLIDIFAMVVMTERRVNAWYSEQARAPRYVSLTMGFWIASSLALIAVDAVR